MCLMYVLYLIFKFPLFGPFLKELLLSKKRRPGEYLDTDLTPDTLRHLWTCTYSDMYYKQAFRNVPAPNPEVIVPQDSTIKQLLDFQIKNRPLILNFGSCSWPVFMTSLQQFKSIVREYNDIADFLIIYIREAHPLDEWNITGHQYSHLRQHVDLQDRMLAASLLDKHEIPCPVVVDPMDNKTTLLYSAAPKRLYVIQDGVVQYAGGMGTHRYRLKDIDRWLFKYKKQLNSQTMTNDNETTDAPKQD